MGQAVKCQLQCRKTKGDRKRRKKHVYSEIPVLSTQLCARGAAQL